MKNWFVVILVILTVTLSACAAKPAASVGSITIEQPWVRSAANGGNTAAFMIIKNSSNQADKLIKADYNTAKMVTLMETAMKDGKMAMADVAAIEIPASGQVELKSGGYHVMLMMLMEELKAGEKATITLTFEKAGAVQVEMPIKSE
jgi:copper(I)-binding protein